MSRMVFSTFDIDIHNIRGRHLASNFFHCEGEGFVDRWSQFKIERLLSIALMIRCLDDGYIFVTFKKEKV